MISILSTNDLKISKSQQPKDVQRVLPICSFWRDMYTLEHLKDSGRVSREVAQSPEVQALAGSRAIGTLLKLTVHAHTKTRMWFGLTSRTMANTLGVTPRTIRKHKARLVMLGLLEQTYAYREDSGRQTACPFRILRPPSMIEQYSEREQNQVAVVQQAPFEMPIPGRVMCLDLRPTDKHYGYIYRPILATNAFKRCRPQTIQMYWWLSTFLDPESRSTELSLTYIQEQLGWNCRAVRDALNQLVEEKLILRKHLRQDHGGDTYSQFTFCLPPELHEQRFDGGELEYPNPSEQSLPNRPPVPFSPAITAEGQAFKKNPQVVPQGKKQKRAKSTAEDLGGCGQSSSLITTSPKQPSLTPLTPHSASPHRGMTPKIIENIKTIIDSKVNLLLQDFKHSADIAFQIEDFEPLLSDLKCPIDLTVFQLLYPKVEPTEKALKAWFETKKLGALKEIRKIRSDYATAPSLSEIQQKIWNIFAQSSTAEPEALTEVIHHIRKKYPHRSLRKRWIIPIIEDYAQAKLKNQDFNNEKTFEKADLLENLEAQLQALHYISPKQETKEPLILKKRNKQASTFLLQTIQSQIEMAKTLKPPKKEHLNTISRLRIGKPYRNLDRYLRKMPNFDETSKTKATDWLQELNRLIHLCRNQKSTNPIGNIQTNRKNE